MASTTAQKIILSGTTNGKAVKIAATASAGDTIHTATSDATGNVYDEIWLYAYNSSASAVVLTIQYGGTTSVDNDIKVTLPATAGLTLVVPGLLLNNSLVVKAYAGTTNVVTVSGFVNRITYA